MEAGSFGFDVSDDEEEPEDWQGGKVVDDHHTPRELSSRRTPATNSTRSLESSVPWSQRSARSANSSFRASRRINSARSTLDESPQPLPILPSLPQLSGWTAAPSASITPDDTAHRQYPFSSQHLGVLFSMLQDMSDSPWAKASAVSYDVVAMERWMNVLLAQRLDGSRIKLEQAQRRIDQAISEELHAVTSAGERSRESHEKLKQLKVERDLIVAKLQRPELESKTSADKETGGDGKDGSTDTRRRTVGVPTSLERLQLDRQTLAELGLSSETIATLYRTIYVFTVGFHEHASHVLDGSSGNHELISRMWRAFSLMAEELSGQSVETELEVAMHALLQQNYELRQHALDAHQQLLRREGEVQRLAQEVESLTQQLREREIQLAERDKQLAALSEGIEVLEIEKDSLTRKNEFLASSLHTIRRRDQARAAVQRLLGKKKGLV